MYSTTQLPYPDCSTELLQKLRQLKMPVLLSSGQSKDKEARFDIISAAPETILRSVLGKSGVQTTIESNDGSIRTETASPFALIQSCFDASAFSANKDESLPFTGGALGYFSYELLHKQYNISITRQKDDPVLPEMLVGIYYWAVIVDHQQHTCTLLVRPQCSQSEETLIHLLNSEASQPTQAFSLTSPFQSNFSAEQYGEAYNKVIDYIHAGDCYQVNLAQRFSASYEGDTLKAFEHLNSKANAPFSAYIEDEDLAVLSFSPERFLKVSNKQVLTQPIKGTRPRNDDPAIDQANLDELKNSTKDKAENLMIVDLLRNDLGRVCKTGSVSVAALFEDYSFTNVHHLISTIKGELNEASEVFDLLEASFPGGSVTGTPKIRSMEIINELETRLRSVYCGSVAYIDFNGDMDSNICIRTLVSDENSIHCWGGGAVVADSTLEQEYQETLDKISLFLDGLSKL